MSFFSDDHVLQAGLQGSAGPSVSAWEMAQQSIRQQFHVDSPLALDAELGTRWNDSLQALRAAGQNFNVPTSSHIYRRYAETIANGAPAAQEGDDINPLYLRGGLPGPSRDIEDMRRADEAIRQLNNPNVKTFQQILEEVIAMQQGIEEETSSMSERTSMGGMIAGILGAAIGSFTIRDPVNLATLPLGWGRTVATRIAVDMAVAGGSTALADYTDVNPNRALAGLPEHNPFYDIGASVLGAGVLRGALFELPGHYLRKVTRAGEDINFDFRDGQMQQMFDAVDTPTSRAASSILDDTIVFERSNPYGEGQVAGYRWQAELDATARALNGEPEAQLDLPPIPSEYVDRHLSFQSVKETVPDLWNELETARTRLSELDNNINEVSARELSIPDAVRLVDEEAGARLDQLEAVVNDLTLPEPVRAAADMEARTVILRVGQDKIMKAVETADNAAKFELRNMRASRKAVNKKYREAYQKVEQEAQRLELAEAAKRSVSQTQSVDVLGPDLVTEPMTGPMTRFDFVEAHEGKVTAADAAIPERADSVNELAIDPETNTVNIGTKTPVSADFKVPFDDGELSVREILDDLAEDKRLEEAVKGCAI